MSLRLNIAVAVAVAALPVGAAAAPAPSWHTGLRIAPFGSSPGDPVAVLGRAGDALAAWPVATAAGTSARIEVRARTGFTAPWRLAWASPVLPGMPAGTAMARGVAGDVVVAWRSAGGAVRSAVRDGTAGRWRLLGVAEPGDATDPADRTPPQITVAPDGTARIAWVTAEAGAVAVRAARRARGGGWTAEPSLSVPVAPQRLAIGATGDAVAVWVVPDPGTEQRIVPSGAVVVARRAAGTGAWGPPEALGDTASGADAALDGRGTVTVAWSAPGGDGARVVLARAERGAAGMGAPQVVAPGIIPRVAVAEAGTVTALAWTDADAGFRAPLRTAVDAGAGWTPSRTLWDSPSFGTVEMAQTRLVVGPTGRVFAAWIDPEGPGSATAVLGAYDSGAAVTRGSQPVGIDTAGITLAAGRDGAALALTSAEVARGGGGTVFAASHDAARRPVLRAAIRGRRLAGTRTTRWTVVVRNRGPVAARGVLLTVNDGCCGNRVASTTPRGTTSRPSRVIRIALGTVRAGAVRVVRITTVAGVETRPPDILTGTLSSVAVPATPIVGHGVPAVADVAPAG